MRFRALILGVAIAALSGAALAGCSDDNKTISLDDWVKKIEAACRPATEEAAKVEPPESIQSVSDPSELTDEQLAEFGDYLEEVAAIVSPAVDGVADAGTPDEKADQAEEYLDNLRQGQDRLDAVVESAQSGDLEQFLKDYEALNSDDDNSDELETELGISCDSSQ